MNEKIMLILTSCLLALIISSGLDAARNQRPKFVRKCLATDSDFSQCWKRGLEELRPYLIKGIPEFNAPSIDPLIVPQAAISQNDDIGTYDLELSNAVYHGAKDYEILDNEFDLENLKFRLKLLIPEVLFRTDFKIDGTLIGFKMNGKGSAYGEFRNMTVELLANGERYTQNGQTFVSWDDSTSKTSYSNPTLGATGLFKSPEVERIFNTVVNANADVVYSHVIVVIRSTFGRYLLEILKRAHKAYPIEVLYGE